MKFAYKSEEDAVRETLTEAGTYDFEVTGAEEKLSKKGNEMIVLKLRVFCGDRERVLTDYLMEAMRFKLIHFAKATSLWAKYEAGELQASDCIGKSGKLALGIEEGRDGYSPKNSVEDYVVAKDGEAPAPAVKRAPVAPPLAEDAGIPF